METVRTYTHIYTYKRTYIYIYYVLYLVAHDEEGLAQPLHLQHHGLQARDHVQVGLAAVGDYFLGWKGGGVGGGEGGRGWMCVCVVVW